LAEVVALTSTFLYVDAQHDRGVEQLVARRAHNPKVAGSSPVPATRSKVKPSLVKASGGFAIISFPNQQMNKFKITAAMLRRSQGEISLPHTP
jgi:hypothetical protein